MGGLKRAVLSSKDFFKRHKIVLEKFDILIVINDTTATNMKLSLALFSLTCGSVGAFVPSASRGASMPTSLALSPEGAMEAASTETVVETAKPAAATSAPLGPTLNGWTPDASLPCYGLPGAIEPLGFFDPAGLSMDKSLTEVKRLREAEVMHGRVASKCTYVSFSCGPPHIYIPDQNHFGL